MAIKTTIWQHTPNADKLSGFETELQWDRKRFCNIGITPIDDDNAAFCEDSAYMYSLELEPEGKVLK